MKTFLKAKCNRTGRWFGLEVEKIGSNPAVITNFVDINEEQVNLLSPEYQVDPHIETGHNLLACKYCHSRKFGNCSCNKNKKVCKPTDKYDFQCVYCDELKIDYSNARGDANLYNKPINVTNLPASAFDKHGNPQGDQFDLIKDGMLHGYKVVVMDYSNLHRPYLSVVLGRKGFETIYLRNTDDIEDKVRPYLNDKKAQIWVLSSGYMMPFPRLYKFQKLINDAYSSGTSLYIWGDNDPLYVEGNIALNELFHTVMKGNYPADQVISIKNENNKCGIIPDHPISTGIINFYEGVTVANIKCTQELHPLVYGSDKIVITAYHEGKARVLVDGGWTRLYDEFLMKAGTERFVVNCAVWLANLEKNENKLPLLK